MADSRKLKPAKNEACSHCKSYAIDRHTKKNPERLCGNCLLLPKAQRDAQEKYAERVAEGRRRADEAAKKAFIDEMRAVNAEEVAEVTGDADKASRVKSAE